MAKKRKNHKFKRLYEYRERNGFGLFRKDDGLKKIFDDCETLEVRLLARDIGDEVFKHGRFRV